MINVFQKFIDTYGLRYKIWLGIQPYVVVANASDVEKILASQTQIDKSSDYDFLHRWLGLGLLTSGGEKWFRRRKQLTPAFHFKILEDFLRVFNEQSAVLRNVLEKKGSQKFDVFPVITHCALDIICETAMGRRINAQEKSTSDYVKAIYEMSETIQYRELRPWLYPNILWDLSPAGRAEAKNLKILHKFTDTVIQERKRERKEIQKEAGSKPSDSKVEDDIYMSSTKKRQAFLDLLLEAQESDPTLTDKQIREETDTFMFEGHDTTSAAASWTTFLLACHPEIQKKVHEELDSIFGDDRTRDVTTADLAKMKYLESCVKEALRIYPSVPFIGRKLTKDLELEDNKKIPAGCIVFIHIYFLHRDRKVFPDPEKFDPDRFHLAENAVGRHPFAYVPFSAGVRNCIGQKFAMMEEKVMVATIFRNFRVKAAIKREEVTVLCEIITRPEDGLYVTLEKR